MNQNCTGSVRCFRALAAIATGNFVLAITAFAGKLWQRQTAQAFAEPWGTLIALLLLSFIATWPILAGALFVYQMKKNERSDDNRRRVCTYCAYDLVGMTTERCPECGSPILQATADDRAVERARR